MAAKLPGSAQPLSVTRTFRAYYSPAELHHLVALQAPPALAESARHHLRQLACGFLQRVATRLGFPRRTHATALQLYHRFHLHFSLADFRYQDVVLAALLVAAKLDDTLKKLRDIQVAAYQVQNLLDGGPGVGEGDPAVQEAHRPHLVGIERLLLQTLCFNFHLHRALDPPDAHRTPPTPDVPDVSDAPAPPPTRDGFTYLVRLAQSLPSLPPALLRPPPDARDLPDPDPPDPARVLKSLTYAAFLLLTDLDRTLAPLSYPPHTCAAACIYLAGFLLVAAADPDGAVDSEIWDTDMVLGWAACCESDEADLDEIAQTLLDLLISLCPSPASASTSASAAAAATLISPLFSPSSASPSDSYPAAATLSTPTSSAAAAGAGSTKAVLSDRDKQLIATGVPNTLAAHPVLGPSASVDGLTQVKIRLRRARETGPPRVQESYLNPFALPLPSSSSSSPPPATASASASATPRKRPREADEVPAAITDAEAEGPEWVQARRWAGWTVGRAELVRLREERKLHERIRAEERAERERLATGGGGGVGGPGGLDAVGGILDTTMTEEERERERRERRERLRPGTVRYRF